MGGPPRLARGAVVLGAVLTLVLLGWGRSTPAGAETTEFQISDPAITEVAGMAAADGEDWYWTLDRGADPQVYAVSPQGDTVGVVDFRAEVSELEAVATSPEGLWVADVGDGQEQREQLAVYRLLDPQPGVTSLYNAWDLVYEDGVARDAEAILVTGDRGLLVLTQGSDPAIWAPSEELSPDGLNTLEQVAPAPAGVSDATVLDDGRLALRTADAVSVLDPDTFAEVARTDVPEQTGAAALTQTLDGDGLLLTGAGATPTVLRVGVPQGLPRAPSPSTGGPGGDTDAPPTDGEQGGETDRTAPAAAGLLGWLTAWPVLVGIGAVLVLTALLVWQRRRTGTAPDRSRRAPGQDPSPSGPSTTRGPGTSPSDGRGPVADPDESGGGPDGSAPSPEDAPRSEPALASVGAPVVGGASPHPDGHPRTPARARAVPSGGAPGRGGAPSLGSPRRALQVSEPGPAELTSTEAPGPAPGAPAPTGPVPTGPAPAATPPVPSAVVAEGVHVEYKVYASGKAAGSGGARTLMSRTREMRTVHALKGVSFTAHQGESIGVLGSNGSGKSTLMRVITGLTTPSAGAVYAAARPNMLGVGAALISGLSGERNIVLGGLALGLSRREIAELRDDIVDFAELEEFIELPMRTYSSGMQQRLKFAIAAAKQHEILIVDEALAVGDRRFRDRSEERIRQIRDSAGTIFLVSHSMTSIRDTCNRALWLDKGTLMEDGEPAEVIKAYEKYKK